MRQRIISVLFLSLLACLLPSGPILAQQAAAAGAKEGPNRAEAYYHFSMGHLYAELAALYGNRGDYLAKAIDHYKQAIQADPTQSLLAEALTDLYFQAGRLNDAVTEAEERLRQNPDALDSRRILGRIYARLIGDQRENRINKQMLEKATEQYEKIVGIDPKDADSWLMLGRLYKVAQRPEDSERAYSRVLELDANSEEAMTGIAMVYADAGDTQRAIEMLERVVELNPNLRTLTTLASAYEQMRDYENAAKVLRRALDRSPRNIELRRALAQDLMLSNQLDEALKEYEEVVATDPKDATSWLRISQIHREKRNFEKAREASQQALKLEPDNLEARYNEINLLEAEGKSEEAIALMKQLVDSTEKRSYSQAERGNRVALLERLALLYRTAEQYEKAIETFRQMGQLEPAVGARVSAQIIDTYRHAREYQKALDEAEAAHRKHPGDRMVALIRASLLADLGKGEQAVAETKKLFDGKNDRETYLTLAQVYEKTKNYPEMGRAVDAAEKLSQSEEEMETIHFMRGAMHERMKEYDQSEAAFRKILAGNPDHASALNYLGYTLADRNVRLEEAYRLISRAVELDPNNGAYLDSLGWVYYRMGRLEEAERYLRRALGRISRDPTINDHLGDVLAKQGRLKEAMAQWQVALKEWETGPPSERDQAEIAKITKKLETARIQLAKESSQSSSKQ